MEILDCPLPASGPTLPNEECPENLGQVVRIILLRRGYPLADTEAAALLKATYTGLVGAVDETKIQITKPLEGTTISGSEPIVEGGDDNSTFLGLEITTGYQSAKLESMIRNVSGAYIAALRKWRFYDIDVAFVNEFGQIAARVGTDGKVYGFPCYGWGVGDKANEGKNTHDKAKIRASLAAGWRDDLKLFKPTDWNPVFDEINAA